MAVGTNDLPEPEEVEDMPMKDALAQANEAAINDWIEDDDTPAREVDGQVIIDKKKLVANMTVMHLTILSQQ